MTPPERAPAPLPQFRLWAGLDAFYALVVATLALGFIPWKTPVANVALLAYAVSFAAAAPWLPRGRRWAWRLAVASSLAGIAVGVAVVTALVASWAYLRAVHGSFGMGASLVSLLLAATAFQILGLYPALRLRALTRKQVRERFGGSHGGRNVATAVLLLVALPLGTGGVVHLRFALSPLPPLSAQAAQQAVAMARAILKNQPAPVVPDAHVPTNGPVFLTLLSQGRVQARAAGQGRDFADAVANAAQVLARNPATGAGTLKLDRSVAEGPVPTVANSLLSLAVNPGRDGLCVANSDSCLLPDDIIAAGAYGNTPLLPFLDEVRLGVDVAWLRQRLAGAADHGLRRFRSEGWVECPAGVCRADRGAVPVAAVDFKQAAIEGGDFILRQQQPDGRFTYLYNPYPDGDPGPEAGNYNLARHAGTAYSLAALHGVDPAPRFSQAADRALAWLTSITSQGCGAAGVACVVDGGRAILGANALALLALAERQRHEPDPTRATSALALARFLLAMQKPNGDFFHVFDRQTGRIDEQAAPRMFSSEEAAFALVAAGLAFNQPEWTRAAERALDFLTGEKYGFFLGRFIYGVDSWTCMAAERAFTAGRRELQKPHYLDFCLGYAEFLRRIQYAPGEAADDDFDGHFGFSYFLVPQAPATAGFEEALTAVLGLARAHGRSVPELEREVLGGLRALVRDQLRPGNDYLTGDPATARGGLRRSLVEPVIRIDFMQHATSAFVRAATLGLPAGPQDAGTREQPIAQQRR